jgi:N-acetylmuramoyl-L-alanine amidase
MKFPILPLLLVLVCLSPSVRADVINGRNYVSLATWARANGFGGCTLTVSRGVQILLTNKTSRLVFQQDSADATINRAGVRLLFPVAKGGFISQLDVDKTLRPLLFSVKPVARKITTICLDPGHGGNEPGFRLGRFFPRYEKTYTLALALELRRQLQAAGFNVVLTRDKDVYPKLPLSERPDIANRRGADLFVSLHFNSAPTDAASVQGVETYCITPVGAASSNDSEGVGADYGPCPANRNEDKSLLLAYEVQHSLVHILGDADRSVRRARYEVLRTAAMPAILIEGGYMSNPAEGRRIFDASWRREMATAIVRGILIYQRMTAPAAAANAGAGVRKPGR